MKCYLHIGTEKTATSTLQQFLNLNREKLSEHGYIYTESTGHANNRKLPVAAYDLNRRDDFTRSHYLYTNDALFSYQKSIIGALKKELSNAGGKKVIFSSEHIQSRLTKMSEIRQLKILLKNLGFNCFSVIIYLRNPAEIAGSLYSTAVKAGSTAAEPPSPEDKYFQNICNHRNTLKKFGAIFGDAALKPKIFHRSELKNGSIISDFLEAINLPNFEICNAPSNQNESLSNTGIEILRRINLKIPKFIDQKPNPLRADIANYFDRYFTNEKYIIPEKLLDQYLTKFQDSNEWVRKKFFPGKQSLFPPFQYPEKSKVEISSDELDRMADLVVEIWLTKQNLTVKECIAENFLNRIKQRPMLASIIHKTKKWIGL